MAIEPIDPAKSPLKRRQDLKKISEMSDEEIAKLSPAEIKKFMKTGADLNEKGEPNQKDSSLRIHIELDLDVEVHLSARVQGDITIGLL